jgi:hypothetical protein
MTEEKTNNNNLIATAAANASAAASSAAQAASSAANNAQIAAKAAAESATAIAVVATDTSWMKKSLSGIEQKLNEMDKAFVTASQHTEIVKIVDNHEVRLNSLETEKTRIVLLLSVATGILTLLVSLLVWHIVGR